MSDQNGKVRFIRINGRVIPVRGKANEQKRKDSDAKAKKALAASSAAFGSAFVLDAAETGAKRHAAKKSASVFSKGKWGMVAGGAGALAAGLLYGKRRTAASKDGKQVEKDAQSDSNSITAGMAVGAAATFGGLVALNANARKISGALKNFRNSYKYRKSTGMKDVHPSFKKLPAPKKTGV